MKSKPLPPQEVLLQLLDYCPDTGTLRHRARVASQVSTRDPRGPEWVVSAFNASWAGREAFTCADPRGYKHGKLLGKKYQAHRIIWKIVHGEDPDTIDHINNNPSDNRIANLRSCSVAENSRNYKKPMTGTSRYRGVCWLKRDRKWAARISNGSGGKRHIGDFTKEIDAAKAYDKAALEMHGEFATLNFTSALT